jgi:hypothetical protein
MLNIHMFEFIKKIKFIYGDKYNYLISIGTHFNLFLFISLFI